MDFLVAMIEYCIEDWIFVKQIKCVVLKINSLKMVSHYADKKLISGALSFSPDVWVWCKLKVYERNY